MESSYWASIRQRHITRRSTLIAGGSAALGAALLAACGGGDSGKTTSAPISDLLTQPVETTKSAKRGGVYKDRLTADTRTLDPHVLELNSIQHNVRAYQTLFKTKPVPGEIALADVQIGDAAESWEMSADKLQLTVKLRAGNKLDPRAPTSGRALEANDVVFTWGRWGTTSDLRNDLVNSLNPNAPIASMSAPDKSTVVVKLALPFADLTQMLALSTTAYFHIIPKEADGGFDIRREQRGSGPFYMTEYTPSTRFVYSRSPSYWDKDYPLVDSWEMPIVPEYATGLAQFKAGQIYQYPVRADELVTVKKDAPQLSLFQTDPAIAGGLFFWGFKDTPKSYFRDQRVRQAFALAIDRDAWIDAFYNVEKFRGEGFPMETRYNSTATTALQTGWWLDPLSKNFGENARYFKKDLAEAKKLLAAAGYPSGFDYQAHYINTAYYGTTFDPWVQTIMGMAAEAGMKGTVDPVDVNIDWRPKYADAKGQFDGFSARLVSPGSQRNAYFAVFNQKGSQFHGFSKTGSPNADGDPFLDEITTKIRGEFDLNKAQALAHQLQQYEAATQYMPYFPGGATSFGIGWPVVGNLGVYRADPTFRYTWIDDSKPPLKAG